MGREGEVLRREVKKIGRKEVLGRAREALGREEEH